MLILLFFFKTLCIAHIERAVSHVNVVRPVTATARKVINSSSESSGEESVHEGSSQGKQKQYFGSKPQSSSSKRTRRSREYADPGDSANDVDIEAAGLSRKRKFISTCGSSLRQFLCLISLSYLLLSFKTTRERPCGKNVHFWPETP